MRIGAFYQIAFASQQCVTKYACMYLMHYILLVQEAPFVFLLKPNGSSAFCDVVGINYRRWGDNIETISE